MTDSLQTPRVGQDWQPILPVELAILVATGGQLPRQGDPGPNIVMGIVHLMASRYPAFGAAPCVGQVLPITANPFLYSVINSNFGGFQSGAFSLPDLRRGLVPVGGTIGRVDHQQLGFNYIIAADPPPGAATYPAVGTVMLWGGNSAPPGWLLADGSTLSATQYAPLYHAIGTTFGGDGLATFGLPNLVGMSPFPFDTGVAVIGVGQGSGTPAVALGQLIQDNRYLAGGLGLNYIICVQGSVPPNGGNGGFPPADPVLGEIVAFAGPSIPPGWLPADGRLLDVGQNQSLFSVIGTTYGGNGTTNFALPDLRGRLASMFEG